MNLTKSDREAFVRAVMDDVPMVDYDEQVGKLLTAAALEMLPEPVRGVYKTHREWIATKFIYPPPGLRGHALAVKSQRSVEEHAVWKEVGELSRQACIQNDARRTLQQKLKATIEACRTLKQAQRMLPEFEKYLPKERGVTGTTNLPVANLVAELTELGWPK
jgi:hypothetical protein